MSCCGGRKRPDRKRPTAKPEPVENRSKTKTNKGRIWNDKPMRSS